MRWTSPAQQGLPTGAASAPFADGEGSGRDESACDDVRMSTPANDGERAPKRHRAWTGAAFGFGMSVLLTIVLLSFQGDEGDIDSAPVWWTFILLTAVGMLLTARLLITSPAWRRFGVGFVAGAIVPVLVVALLVLWLFLTL
jgi:hypothetical protein